MAVGKVRKLRITIFSVLLGTFEAVSTISSGIVNNTNRNTIAKASDSKG